MSPYIRLVRYPYEEPFHLGYASTAIYRRRPCNWIAICGDVVTRLAKMYQCRVTAGSRAVPQELVLASALQRAMLFEVAVASAEQLLAMPSHVESETPGHVLIRSPHTPGYQWVATGVGDFSIGTRLIEVKCTNKLFSSSDYRQAVRLNGPR
jgi:hypothetical protein